MALPRTSLAWRIHQEVESAATSLSGMTLFGGILYKFRLVFEWKG
jgi:hypothetical protein